MKKTLIIGVCLMLIGCSSATAKGAGRFAEITVDRVNDYMITAVEDNQTGCQYMITSYGVTPLYGKDGKPLCR